MQAQEQAQDRRQDQNGVQQDPAQAPAAAGKAAPAAAKGLDEHPGGADTLGKKENLLGPFYEQMKEVADSLAAKFEPFGLHFRPEILLATTMQESANKDPLTNRSFDNGLGLMQITPYKGQLDANVAKAIGWDNSKDVEWNVQHSNWRDAKANLTAGAYTMLGKATSIKSGASHVWEQMDEPHKWRAVLFAYNAGEGAALKVLRTGGPNAPMISTFTYKGKEVSHDYTAEIKQKMDYVDGHDPFGGQGAPAKAGAADPKVAAAKGGGAVPAHPEQDKKPEVVDKNPIHGSVGAGGHNAVADVKAVQMRLKERGIDPGSVDGQMGPHTIKAIEAFQSSFMAHPDGLIEAGHGTETRLFQETAAVHPVVVPQPTAPAAAAAPVKAHAEDEKAAPKQVKDAGLSRVEGGVKLTDAIASAWKVLMPFLPASAVMTSGLRTDEDQANLIHRYYAQYHGPANITDAEGERQWLKTEHSMIIAPVGSSPHRTGFAFDVSGAPIAEINAAVHRCKAEKPNEFHLKDTIVERANNCIHVDLAG